MEEWPVPSLGSLRVQSEALDPVEKVSSREVELNIPLLFNRSTVGNCEEETFVKNKYKIIHPRK